MRDRRRRHPAQLLPQMTRARESRPAACRCRDRPRPREWSCHSCRHCRGVKDTGNVERVRRYKSLQISRALKHAGKANERGCPPSVGTGSRGRKETSMTNPFATTTLLGLLLFGMITVAAWAPQDTVVVAPLLR